MDARGFAIDERSGGRRWIGYARSSVRTTKEAELRGLADVAIVQPADFG
jgi:hypothetical protein